MGLGREDCAMNEAPDDIFAPQGVDPDTPANLGPLRRLAKV